MKELQHINKYFYKYKYSLLFGVLITIAAKIFSLFTPRLVGDSITVVSKNLKGELSDELFKSELLLNIIYLILRPVENWQYE